MLWLFFIHSYGCCAATEAVNQTRKRQSSQNCEHELLLLPLRALDSPTGHHFIMPPANSTSSTDDNKLNGWEKMHNAVGISRLKNNSFWFTQSFGIILVSLRFLFIWWPGLWKCWSEYFTWDWRRWILNEWSCQSNVQSIAIPSVSVYDNSWGYPSVVS